MPHTATFIRSLADVAETGPLMANVENKDACVINFRLFSI